MARPNAQHKWLLFACSAISLLLIGLWRSPKSDGLPAMQGVRDTSLPSVTTEFEPEAVSRALVSSSDNRAGALDVEEFSTSLIEQPSTRAARVQGRVLDSFDRPVNAVRVALYQGRNRREFTTVEDGRFQFSDLSLGLHRLFVVPESLADGYLPPWRQSQARAYDGVATGIGGTSFFLEAGANREVDLRVFSAAIVSGVVTGPASEAVEGALVSLRSQGGVRLTARSTREGSYRFDAAYPGRYSVQVEAPSEHFDYAGLCPKPFSFELQAAERRELPALEFGAGGSQIVGRVVDAEGVGVPGWVVVAHSESPDSLQQTWRSKTDEEGRYRLGRLPAIRVVLELQGDGNRLEPRSESMAIECTGDDEVIAIEDWPVELPRPFEVQCRIEVDSAWARRLDLNEYTLELRQGDAPADNGALGSRQWIDPARAEFHWSCPTPSAPVTLAVVLADPYGRQHTRELRVAPLANGREERVLHFP